MTPGVTVTWVSCCVTNLTVITSTWANAFWWIRRTALWRKKAHKSTAFGGLLRNRHAISSHLHGWLLLSGRWGSHLTGTAPQLHAISKTHPNLRRTVTTVCETHPCLEFAHFLLVYPVFHKLTHLLTVYPVFHKFTHLLLYNRVFHKSAHLLLVYPVFHKLIHLLTVYPVFHKFVHSLLVYPMFHKLTRLLTVHPVFHKFAHLLL